MSDQPNRRRALIVSDFTDAGTGESFTAGDEPMVDAGAFANYEHAGLVTTPAPRSTPRAPAKSKARRKAATKASDAAPAAPPVAAPATASEASAPAA